MKFEKAIGVHNFFCLGGMGGGGMGRVEDGGMIAFDLSAFLSLSLSFSLSLSNLNLSLSLSQSSLSFSFSQVSLFLSLSLSFSLFLSVFCL